MNARQCLPLVVLLAAVSAAAQTNTRQASITLRSRPTGGGAFFTDVAVVGSALAQPPEQPFAAVDASGTWQLVPGMDYQIWLLANCSSTLYFAPNVSLGQQFDGQLQAVFDLPASVTWSTTDHRHETGAGIAGQAYHLYQSMGTVLPWQDASAGAANGHSASGSTSIALVPLGSGPAALTLTATAEVNSMQATPTPPFVGAAGYAGQSTIDFVVTQSMLLTMHVVASGEVRGESQSFPILPIVPPFDFFGPSRAWYDPPLALGFDFQQSGSSLFTDILSLPVGIDGDGLFEVEVAGQSLGQFAAGSRVDFRQILGGNGVAAFRIVGIDPAVDSTDAAVFPVQLAFDTPTAEFTMTPVLWRKVGTNCSDAAICAQCPALALTPVGAAINGNLNFGFAIDNGPTNGLAACYLGFGSASPSPLPLLCGAVVLPLQNGVHYFGTTTLLGTSSCDGAGSVPLPLVPVPSLLGVFLTVQALTLCPGGGLGLTHGIEFAIGS
jgi:hypothetical protein